MKIRLSDAYISQLIVRINNIEASAKTFDWDQIGGQESAQNWYDAFKEGCEDIEEHRKLTGNSVMFANSLALLKSTMAIGRLKWTEIKEYGF